MIKFYYNTGPNPMKVALFLEEANIDYEAIPVDTRKGEQHKDNYLKINPNAKAPTIVDGDNVEVSFSTVENVPVFPRCERGNNEKKRKCMSDKIAKFVQRNFKTNRTN